MSCRVDLLSLGRSIKTLYELLTDRGYDLSQVGLLSEKETVIPFEWTEQTHDSLMEHCFSESQHMFVSHPELPVLVIFIHWKPLVGHHDLFKSIQFVLTDCPELTCLTSFTITLPASHLMMITSTPLRTSDWKDLLPFQKKIRIEAFHQDEIEFNRTRHEYVPHHELLKREDAIEILRSLNTSGPQCPRILQSDMICRYYGGRVGDVFRIDRFDAMTGDREITFRIVTC